MSGLIDYEKTFPHKLLVKKLGYALLQYNNMVASIICNVHSQQDVEMLAVRGYVEQLSDFQRSHDLCVMCILQRLPI